MDTVKKLKLIEFLDGLYFATIITSLFAVSHNISLSQVVFGQGIYSLTIILMEVPTGVVADKFGRKVSMGFGYLVTLIGLVSFVIWPTVLIMYVMRFLQATGSALVSGANEALLFEASTEAGLNYKKESSTVNANAVIGLCFAGIIAGLFYEIYGDASFVPLMLATAAFQVAAVVLSFSIKERPYKDDKSMVEKEVKVFGMLADTIGILRTNKTIFALTMFGMLATCNEYFLYQTYAPYFKGVGVSNFWVGAAFSFGLFLNFILVKNIWKIERYLTLEKSLVIIKFVAAVGYVGLALATKNALLVIILISTIGIFNIERPIISDYVNQEIGNHIRSTVLSGMSLISRITKAALTFVIGGLIVSRPVTSGYLITSIYLIIGTLIGYWLLVRCGCVRKITHNFADN